MKVSDERATLIGSSDLAVGLVLEVGENRTIKLIEGRDLCTKLGAEYQTSCL